MTDLGRDAGAFDDDSVDGAGRITDTRVYQGDLEARPPDVLQPDSSEAERLHFLEEQELRVGETDDPNEAAEEGLTYIAPVDPPTVGSQADGDPRVAAGFGTTAVDEPFDADHRAQSVGFEDEVTGRVREALLAHASTSGYADMLGIETAGGIVRVTGRVSDLVDEEHIQQVISEVEGVTNVDSRLEIEGITS
jgi:hypothetical protein